MVPRVHSAIIKRAVTYVWELIILQGLWSKELNAYQNYIYPGAQNLKIGSQSVAYLINLFISLNWRSSAYKSFKNLIRRGVDRNYTVLYYEMETVECVLGSLVELMEQVYRYPASDLWNETSKQAWFQSYFCQPNILCCHQYHCWNFCFVISLISPYVLLCLLK